MWVGLVIVGVVCLIKFLQSLNENLVMERDKVSHLVNQLSDDTVAIELATSLEESTKLQQEKNELQEKVKGVNNGGGRMED